jgi:hypothetical protein
LGYIRFSSPIMKSQPDATHSEKEWRSSSFMMTHVLSSYEKFSGYISHCAALGRRATLRTSKTRHSPNLSRNRGRLKSHH